MGSFKFDGNKKTISNQIVAAMDSAKSSLKIAHAHFRTPEFHEAVLRAYLRGTKFEILLDQQEFRPGSPLSSNLAFEAMLDQKGVDVRYKVYSIKWNYMKAKQMHAKYMIVDNAAVYTGSYNWSLNSENNTFESLVVLKDPASASRYLTHFAEVTKLRAGDFAVLMEKLNQGPVAADCRMSPMTMTIAQFTEFRSAFKNNICR